MSQRQSVPAACRTLLCCCSKFSHRVRRSWERCQNHVFVACPILSNFGVSLLIDHCRLTCRHGRFWYIQMTSDGVKIIKLFFAVKLCEGPAPFRDTNRNQPDTRLMCALEVVDDFGGKPRTLCGVTWPSQHTGNIGALSHEAGTACHAQRLKVSVPLLHCPACRDKLFVHREFFHLLPDPRRTKPPHSPALFSAILMYWNLDKKHRVTSSTQDIAHL